MESSENTAFISCERREREQRLQIVLTSSRQFSPRGKIVVVFLSAGQHFQEFYRGPGKFYKTVLH